MTGRELTPEGGAHADYWDELAAVYQEETRISLDDFHYGPLLPGDSELGLLPADLKGRRCLELGCGAGQNSIVLAKRGAVCTALDVSANQLDHGHRLASEAGVDVDFRLADLDALPGFDAPFALIHSAYGLPFSSDPERVIRECADRLAPGGRLLFSMGHPVYAGEWLDLDGEEGLFLHSYFHPTPDTREGDSSQALSRAYPVSEPVEWLHRAGLRLERLLEPASLPPHRLSEAPYTSDAWSEQAGELSRFPIVAIYSALR